MHTPKSGRFDTPFGMRKQQMFARDKENLMPPSRPSAVEFADQFSLLKCVESWSGKHIARWIEGLGDTMNPFLGTIRDNIHCGTHLFLVDNETLLDIGISGLGPRKMIIQAIQLLIHFCYEAPSENLQNLSMKVVVACNDVVREMLEAVRLREKESPGYLTTGYFCLCVPSTFVKISNKITSIKEAYLMRKSYDRENGLLFDHQPNLTEVMPVTRVAGISRRYRLLYDVLKKIGAVATRPVAVFCKACSWVKSRPEIIAMLNNITNAVSILAEHAKKLIFWLDRSPFDVNDTFLEMRNKVSTLIWTIVRHVNAQPKAILNVVGDIVSKTNELRKVCRNIIQIDHTSILYPAYVEEATLKRCDSNTNWGINLQSSYRGVHVISEITLSSPADLCGKIDAGDEIMLINGNTVIGWDLTRVAARLGAADNELHLIVNKRPRDVVLMKKSNKVVTRPLAKMAPGSQATNTVEDNSEKIFMQAISYPLSRRRSSTFIAQIINIHQQKIKRPSTTRRKRRASIGSDTPQRETGIRQDEPQHTQWNLLETIRLRTQEGDATRVVRRARTMRHRPDGYVRSFIDNKLVQEIEDDGVVAEQLPFNIKCPTEFAVISIAVPEELAQLRVPDAQITDAEWDAPINESAFRPFRALAGDSNLSGFNLDSPRRAVCDDAFPTFGGVLASPSASSIHSFCSLAHTSSASVTATVATTTPPTTTTSRLMNTSISDCASQSTDEVPPTPSTPGTFSFPGEKVFEGWVRRRKTGNELSGNEATNKWPKCWMSLRGPYLCFFNNQHTKITDMTINISKYTVSDTIDLKTSKKHVFRLSRGAMEYHFSCYTQNDMKNWIAKITATAELHGSNGRMMSKSVSYYKDSESGDEKEHYNTMTGGLCSLMSQSHHEGMSSSGGSPLVVHATVPRPLLVPNTVHATQQQPSTGRTKII